MNNFDKDSCLHEIIDELPITREVFRYAKTGKRRFHTPGHKGEGHALSEILQIANDVTEVEKLDNLLNPSGCIRRSMDEMKAIFGSKETYFVTQGGTTAVLSSIFAVKDFGKIAILRSSHNSVYNGIEIANIQPTIVNDVDEFGRAKIVTVEMLKSVLDDESVKTVLLTRPTYTGDCFDIEKIANAIKAKNKFLIVDEAHGTHFAFSKNFPINAGKYADIVINSAHKTLPTLTGGAILSVYNEKLLDKVDKAYHMFQSTSPSYLTLMSIEYGVYLLNKTPALVENLIEAMLNLKGRLIAKGLKLHKNEDVTRLVVDTEKMGISGKELDMRLQECKVFCEYSTMSEVVFIMSVFDDEKELLTLGDIILDCVSQCGQIKIEKHLFPKSKKTLLKYLDASNAEAELVD
ncbi:MAG: aminotransferase class I/II-fold pyridoxal phosphate-dependent enzyme, partial [Clostridia bacterium]